MFKVQNGTVTNAFQNKLQGILHDYFTKKSMYNDKEPRCSLKILKLALSSRGSRF